MTITSCVILSSGKRDQLLSQEVLPSVQRQGFDEILLVGPFGGDPLDIRHLPLEQVWNSTVDGLLQRDVGAVATRGDRLVYLCDDHKLDDSFGDQLRTRYSNHDWDVLVPTRATMRDGRPIRLNMGMEKEPIYCGGHCGVFTRQALREVPWMMAPHKRCWDLMHSQMLLTKKAVFVDAIELLIWDIEPGAEPWR